ncbi:MAG: hypothetical protein IPM79_04860 [Polyangiaceae bacterium]|jgi:hypothetical protein|nr:hypothetical protein [Polyangiaceae bacterium]MBK8936976.1 hypothetical protein [Polyangiaceae bacterium]
MRTLILLFTAALVVPACGDDSETGTGGSGNTSNNGAGPNEGGSGGAPASCDFAELDLEGTWALKVTIPASTTSEAGGAFESCPASQSGDVVVTLGMSVSELSNVFGARLALCSISFPTVAADTAACGTGTSFDLSLVRNNDRLFDNQTESETIELAGLEPGAAFTLPPVAFYYGSPPPLREWDTADVACDDPLLGHGGTCEEACLSGGCMDMDYWNDDFPGFTWGVCGVGEGQSINDCDPDDPLAGIGTVQGNVFTNVAVTMDISGTFDTSCTATATAPTTIDMTVVGGDVYVEGQQVNVTALANALPQFNLAGSGATVEMIRVDGRHGTPDYAENDLRDSCEAIAESLGGAL